MVNIKAVQNSLFCSWITLDCHTMICELGLGFFSLGGMPSRSKFHHFQGRTNRFHYPLKHTSFHFEGALLAHIENQRHIILRDLK
jgi:hypothetical protein